MHFCPLTVIQSVGEKSDERLPEGMHFMVLRGAAWIQILESPLAKMVMDYTPREKEGLNRQPLNTTGESRPENRLQGCRVWNMPKPR